MKYILSAKAIKLINKTPGVKAKLSLALKGLSENSINRLLRENSINSDLTKLSSLEVLRAELKMEIDQIVKEVKSNVIAKEARLAYSTNSKTTVF